MSLTKDGFFKQLGSTTGSNNYLLQAAGGHIAWGNAASQIPYSNGTVNTNLNADMVDGLHVHTGKNNEANKIVRTDGNGYIQAGWINTTSGNMGTSAIDRIYVSNDGFIRYKTKENFANELRDSGYLDGRYLLLSGGTLTGSNNVLTLSNTSGGAIGLLFKRNSNTAWQIVDNGGNLYFTENNTNTNILLLKESSQGGEGYIKGNLIYHAGNLTKVSQLTNDSGYVTSSGVTSITLKAGAGISLDVNNTAITSTGTRTITNAGVRAVTINGNYLRVNTNGTNADLTIPYATNADTIDGYHTYESQLYHVVKSLTMTTVNTVWYLKIMLSGYAQPDHIFITCSYNNEIDKAHIYFSGMSNGYIYRNNNQNQGNIKAIALKAHYDSTEHLWIFYLKFDKIFNSSDQHYSPSSSATVSVYTLNNSAFNIAIETTEPTGVTWIETGHDNNNLIIKNATLYGVLYGNASTATKLQTARNINGTAFDGSANITTANWGTSRTITIGNTGKSVNGSGNVSWSLAEIGVASSGHTHTFAQITNKITAGNEFNFVDAEQPIIWINYRRASGSVATTPTTQFHFGEGTQNSNYAYIVTKGYKKNGSSDSYVLTGAGGHQAWGNGTNQIPYSNGTVNTNLNADMTDGLHVHTSRNNEANKIVRTDGSGYIQAGWINTTSGNMGTSAIDRIYCSSDGFIRYKTKENFAHELRDSGYLDGRYLKLSGGTMSLGEGLQFHADENYFGTNLDARIISLLDGNGTTCDGGLIIDERATSNGNTTITELLRIRDNEFKWKGNTIWHAGNDGSGSGLDADLLDGVHASGLFTNFGNSGNNITATIGGTTKTFTVNYASNAGNADTLDGYHAVNLRIEIIDLRKYT